ncbi:NADPH-dependent F420 reductase [Gulosibacter chungangensis]|uniref:NADPH-dependent F420 reductase n=1 Tax=Gulosibacter chungangensis TaxID=979746 RepID=A0A7J5BFX6_9MICO|nr:NADPH-dependent F420 reductase [Gulosibacter chungangensis]KAB1645155.1 NADPH-dependent F420 reductase [Gulosibacter chungangensis]
MEKQTIAVLGGTGPQGKGLAYRFAKHGHSVIIGSRDEARGAETVAEIQARLGSASEVTAAANSAAAEAADVVVIAVPYKGHAPLLTEIASVLRGKVVIDCVNPLAFDQKGPHSLDVEERSAAEECQRLVPEAQVTGAFHLVSAVNLWSEDEYLDHEDILVCGDDKDAKAVVAELAATVSGRLGVDVGPLRMARYIEPLTAMIISINKKYKVRAGITISGLENSPLLQQAVPAS